MALACKQPAIVGRSEKDGRNGQRMNKGSAELKISQTQVPTETLQVEICAQWETQNIYKFFWCFWKWEGNQNFQTFTLVMTCTTLIF